MHIGIIDYHAGNPVSVMHMMQRIGVPSFISSDVHALAKADKLILPGIGAFDHTMSRLRSMGIAAMLEEQVRVRGIPFLGICLGMQAITIASEEGNKPGLGWLYAHTVRFPQSDSNIKVPNTGWRHVQVQKSSSLFDTGHDALKFYFAHSYHVVCNDAGDVLCTSRHGSDFVAAIEKDNIVAVQFHPEKSGIYGASFLKNFATRL